MSETDDVRIDEFMRHYTDYGTGSGNHIRNALQYLIDQTRADTIEPDITHASSKLEKIQAAIRAINRAKDEAELAERIFDAISTEDGVGGAYPSTLILREALERLVQALVEGMLALQKEEHP